MIDGVIQDRIAGMTYSQVSAKHGMSPWKCRHICKRALRAGKVTAEQIGHTPLKVKRPHAPPYHKLYEKLIKRIMIDERTGCWNWTGPSWNKRPHPGNRYGFVMVWNGEKYKTIGAHRAMMIAKHGPLTKEQCVCHKCDNVLCINPEHLFIGSMGDNIRDSRSKNRHHEGQKTHCLRGHELSGENLRVRTQHPPKTGIRRVCVTCEKLRASRNWRKKRAALSADEVRK